MSSLQKVNKFLEFQEKNVFFLSQWHHDMIILWKRIIRKDLHSFFKHIVFVILLLRILNILGYSVSKAALSWLPLLPDLLTDSERFHLTEQIWEEFSKRSLKKAPSFVFILVSLTSKEYWRAKSTGDIYVEVFWC